MTSPLELACLHLFVPADRPDRISKAISSGADAVIVDLEDAVAPDLKVRVRAELFNWLKPGKVPLILRINAVGTPWHGGDLDAARQLPVDAVMLAKAESADDVESVATVVKRPVIALVESARGVENAVAIARSSARLAFGSIDYAVDLRIGHTKHSLLMARSQLVFASRLAGIPAPIDGVTTAIDKSDVLEDDCTHAVEMGFSGKLLIHPRQVEAAARGFLPRDEEVEWARRIVGLAQQHSGALNSDGEMVDAPVIARARLVLERVREIAR